MKVENRVTCVAILRGINVSGKNMIKMPALAHTFTNMGFTNVRTYIQSGNVIFETGAEIGPELEAQICDGIKKDFGFDVPVLVIEARVLKQIQEENPYMERGNIDITKLHITFLADEPHAARFSEIDAEKYLPDEFILKGKALYLYCPTGYGNTKLNNNFFENKLKVRATTRNWNTVNKLVELTNG
jgi:uncharacterized protein (DUF1697 family)